MIEPRSIWNILAVIYCFLLSSAFGCEQLVYQDGVIVSWFRSPVTGRCLNVVPYQTEWFTALALCRQKLGDLATVGYTEEEQQLYEMIKDNQHLQNWTYWINATHANSSDVYFKVERNMDQILYVPYGVKLDRKGFICEYDLMNPAKRVAGQDEGGPTFTQFLGVYTGFTLVLLACTVGMVAYINNRRKKAYENYYGGY